MLGAAMERLHEDFRRIRPPLEGSLVRLRAVEEADLPALHQMFNDPEVLYYLQVVTFPEAFAGTRAWWESSRRDRSVVNFVIETLPGELAGACGLSGISDRTRHVTLGIWLGPPFWDRGFGTDAVRTVCRFAFREMNLRRVELHVFETNPRGQRAYEKAGFRDEGRLRSGHFVDGRPVDVIVMALLAEELVEA